LGGDWTTRSDSKDRNHDTRDSCYTLFNGFNLKSADLEKVYPEQILPRRMMPLQRQWVNSIMEKDNSLKKTFIFIHQDKVLEVPCFLGGKFQRLQEAPNAMENGVTC